jgi:hypothetical protein
VDNTPAIAAAPLQAALRGNKLEPMKAPNVDTTVEAHLEHI